MINARVSGDLLGVSDAEIAALEAVGMTGVPPNWAVHEYVVSERATRHIY